MSQGAVPSWYDASQGTPDIRSWLVGLRPLNGSSEGVPDCSDNFVYPVPEVDERIAGDDRAMAPGTPSGSKSSRLSPSSIAYEAQFAHGADPTDSAYWSSFNRLSQRDANGRNE